MSVLRDAEQGLDRRRALERTAWGAGSCDADRAAAIAVLARLDAGRGAEHPKSQFASIARGEPGVIGDPRTASHRRPRPSPGSPPSPTPPTGPSPDSTALRSAPRTVRARRAHDRHRAVAWMLAAAAAATGGIVVAQSVPGPPGEALPAVGAPADAASSESTGAEPSGRGAPAGGHAAGRRVPKSGAFMEGSGLRLEHEGALTVFARPQASADLPNPVPRGLDPRSFRLLSAGAGRGDTVYAGRDDRRICLIVRTPEGVDLSSCADGTARFLAGNGLELAFDIGERHVSVEWTRAGVLRYRSE